MRPGGDFASRVRAQPSPAQVTPTGPWSATLAGSGARFMMYGVTGGAIPGALTEATFRLPGPDENEPFHRPLNLTLPDGSTWRPEGTFRLEGSGPLTFTGVQARDGMLDVGAKSLQAILAPASGPVTAVGAFVAPDGRRTDRLALPPTARVGEDCGRPSCSDPDVAPLATLAVAAGFTVSGQTGPWAGEVSVAGTARAQALGRSWEGLVGAVEGRETRGTATWDGRTWSVSATAGTAHQVWVDVWPVATTTLSATSAYDPGPHSCFRNCSVRFRWANTGWATSHILEAEGSGPGSGSVRFGLTDSYGHDAGLGIRRGGKRKNLGNGDAIFSTMAPGGKGDRGLTTKPGSSVVVVLRGNFPDVTVQLAIP